jgi:outer membrane protein TolC
LKHTITRIKKTAGKPHPFLPIIGFLILSFCGHAQDIDSTGLSLGQCIDYALKHQPLLKQADININIARVTNSINQAGWLPQASISGNLLHYNELPTSFVNNSSNPNGSTKQKTGVVNTFGPQLSVTQTIFNPSLVYAVKSAPLFVQQAELVTDSTKIFVIASVSKSFYNLLLTLEQIDVLKEDTVRLAKNLSDTYHQYVAGIVAETDYQQATITLNNSRSQLKQAVQNMVPQYAFLKQIMGYPSEREFNVRYDTTQMIKDIVFDTTRPLQYDKRVEFQQVQLSKKLQDQTINYYRSAWLPTVSAFFDYFHEFQSNTFSTLFSTAYPYSYVGLSFSMPIFTGFARTNSLHRAKLQQQLIGWDEISLKSEIYSQYASALTNYKNNLYDMYTMQDNVALAKHVYETVTLQYHQGIVAYLNVITAESNLISSEISYYNDLFQVLSDKIDLEKAMGIISYNH